MGNSVMSGGKNCTHVDTLFPEPGENTSRPSTYSPILTLHDQSHGTSFPTIDRISVTW